MANNTYKVTCLINRPIEESLLILLGEKLSHIGAIAVAADYLARVGTEIFPDSFIESIVIEAD